MIRGAPLGFFGQAKKMMGSWSPPAPSSPQYFQVYCAEGHSIEGRRTESYQALRCPNCGAGVFVLPLSPLPEPKIPNDRSTPRHVAKPTWRDDEAIPLTDPVPFDRAEAIVEIEVEPEPETKPVAARQVDRIEWVDEEEEAPSLADEPVLPPGSVAAEFDPEVHLDAPSHHPAKSKTSQPAKPKARPTAAPAIEVRERVGLGRKLWKARNALIFVAVVLIVAATIGQGIWRKKLEGLPKDFERGKTEGIAALERGEFGSAKQILQTAAEAIRLLGGRLEDPEVENVRQAADEAAIYADLMDLSLETLVDRAARARPGDDWPSTFKASVEGRSIVIEAHVTAVPDPGQPDSTYEIDYRIGYGKGSTPDGRGRIDLKGFRLTDDAHPKLGDRLAFGARVAAVEFELDRKEWVVKLEPKSGVFVRHYKALRYLGWPAEDESSEEEKP